MLLRYSNGSPFGRKASMAAHALGLAGKIKMVDHAADAENTTRQRNPLHKIPMLITDSGTEIFDSPVIMEYLDHVAGGGKLFPAEGEARYKALSKLALADGITEASVLIHYEDRWRTPEQRNEKWVEHQRGKVERALGVFENDIPAVFDGAAMGLFCAIYFVDRQKDIDWRAKFPKLAAWYDRMCETEPSAIATQTKG
ncbi:MAG: glutathione S-transferase family protein [Beijerinckiaceae bacterium]